MIRSSAKRWRSMSRKSSSRVARGTPGAATAGMTSVGKELLQGTAHRLEGRKVRVFELGRERHGRVGRRDEDGRRVEVLEALAGDEGEDLAGDAARARGFLEHEKARGARDRLEHGLAVEGPHGAEVEHLGVEAVGRAKREGAAAERRPDDEGKPDARAPVSLGGDGDDGVERAGDEVCELELDDGPLAHPGRADGGSDEALVRDRHVHDALVAELLPEPIRDAESAAEVADVLTEEEDALVVAESIRERGPDRLEVRDLAHENRLTSAQNRHEARARPAPPAGRLAVGGGWSNAPHPGWGVTREAPAPSRVKPPCPRRRGGRRP